MSGTLVSGNIRFMLIFAGLLWTGGVKLHWVAENGDFSVLSLSTSSEASELRPTLLYIII